MTSQYRILIPSEYEALLDAIEKERLRIVIETLLNTGGRYSELLYLAKHLKTFDHKNNAIVIPAKDTKQGRAELRKYGEIRQAKDRVIHLTPAFSKRLYQYLREHKSLEVPTARVMNTNLKRWWGSVYNIEEMKFNNLPFWNPSVKTFRKTWESWLLAAGYPSMAVALSQGHSELIAYGHYANLDPRLKSEMDEVKKLTEGWGT